jgi:hypothetical protein
MNEVIKSKNFKIAAAVIGVILIALASFVAGMSVGFHKANFSGRFGENYEKNFMGPRPGMKNHDNPMGKMKDKFREMEGRDFRNAHGLSGTIISITDNNLVVKDRDDKENTLIIDDKTIIKSHRDNLKVEDLKQGDRIIVLGEPNDSGVIDAKLIRVFNDNIQNN